MVYICIPTTKERRSRLSVCLDAIRENANYSDYCIMIYENDGMGCVAATRKMLKDLGNNLVLVLNDDMLGQADFLRISVEFYNSEFPNNDGLCALNDGVQDISNIDNYVASVQFAPADLLYKYIYSGYFHYFNDNELADIFRSKDKFSIVYNSKIDHVHHGFKHDLNLLDLTYMKTQEHYEEDEKLYMLRKQKSNNFTDLSQIEGNY